MFYKDENDQQKSKKWNDFAEKPEGGITVDPEELLSDTKLLYDLETYIDQIDETREKDNEIALHDALYNIHTHIYGNPLPLLSLLVEKHFVTQLMDLLQPDSEKISYVTLLVLCDLSCSAKEYEEEMLELGIINAAKEFLRIPRGRRAGVDLDKVFILLLSNILIDCTAVDLFDSELANYVLSAVFRSTNDQVVYYITKFAVVYLNRIPNAPIEIRSNMLSLVQYNSRKDHRLIKDYTMRILSILMNNNYIDDESISPITISNIFDEVENFDSHSFFACVEVASKRFPEIYKHMNVDSGVIMNKLDSECLDDENFEINALCLIALSSIILNIDQAISDVQIEMINDLIENGTELRFSYRLEIVQFAAITILFITQTQFDQLNHLNLISYIRDYLESCPEGQYEHHFDNVVKCLCRFADLKSHLVVKDGEEDEIFNNAVRLALDSVYLYPKTEDATRFVEMFDSDEDNE